MFREALCSCQRKSPNDWCRGTSTEPKRWAWTSAKYRRAQSNNWRNWSKWSLLTKSVKSLDFYFQNTFIQIKFFIWSGLILFYVFNFRLYLRHIQYFQLKRRKRLCKSFAFRRYTEGQFYVSTILTELFKKCIFIFYNIYNFKTRLLQNYSFNLTFD